MVKVRFKQSVHDAGLHIYDAGEEYDVPENVASAYEDRLDRVETKQEDVGPGPEARTAAKNTPGTKR